MEMTMLNAYFILGTDTDCGKTYVTAALIDYYRSLSKPILGLKPIASGVSVEHNRWLNQDISTLEKANQQMPAPICGWLMPDPIAPHLAAAKQGLRLSAQDIVNFCRDYPRSQKQTLLIEGAGGLLVPLNESESWIDVLKQSQLPVILVVGMRLGCINHALLTQAVLAFHGIQCLGWIANSIDPQMLSAEDNLNSIQSRMAMPLLGRVAYQGRFVPVEQGQLA